MITFVNGPAKGVNLNLSRAPQFLRVVENTLNIFDAKKWDALDRLEDTPTDDEIIHAYKLVSDVSHGFVDGRDPKTGKHFGHAFVGADYSYVQIDQPDDEVMRDTARWQAWCAEHREECGMQEVTE